MLPFSSPHLKEIRGVAATLNELLRQQVAQPKTGMAKKFENDPRRVLGIQEGLISATPQMLEELGVWEEDGTVHSQVTTLWNEHNPAVIYFNGTRVVEFAPGYRQAEIIAYALEKIRVTGAIGDRLICEVTGTRQHWISQGWLDDDF